MKFFLFIIFFTVNIFATDYYVKNSGNDAADGTSDATAWKTIAKVNASIFKPGDNIYFKRGDMWREQLNVSSSGAEGKPITFSAYGTGEKPIFNGANLVAGWKEKSNNIWYVKAPYGSNEYGLGHGYVTINNDSLCTEYSSVAALINPYSVCYSRSSSHDSGYVYIYSITDPNSNAMQISARNFGIYLDSKSYINIDNLETIYTGHTGIYLYGSGTTNSIVSSCNAIKNRLSGIQMFEEASDNIIEYDTCEYNGNGFYSASYAASGSNNNIFRNCYSAHNIRYASDIFSDGHGFGIYNSDGCVIENNIALDNMYNINMDLNGGANNDTIRYNYLSESKQNSSGITVGNVGRGGEAVIYYNLMVNNGGTTGWGFSVEGASTGSIHFFNNTIYQDDRANTDGGGIYLMHADGVTLENNIICSLRNPSQALLYNHGTVTTDYNLFYNPNSSNIFYDLNTITGYTTLAAWQTASKQDANSKEVDPLFANPTNNNFSLQNESLAINTGINIGLSKDFNGYSVPIYKPDIGAIQHSYIKANLKVYLEGPYQNDVMTTYLDAQNLIPKTQPYNISPWNYAGTESVLSVPSSIVDWVLVELRFGITSNSIIAKRAGFLKSDGSIVDLDGNSPLRFDFVPEGKYYIVVRHRNHLAIMSSSPVMISNSSSLYDFTTSKTQAYGINPMLNLGNNVYGMYGGDGDANGGVSSADRNDVWRVENGRKGYLQGDFDLNGTVDNNDLNLHWSKVNGNLTQVP